MPDPATPDLRFFFFVNLAAVFTVALFACAVVVVLLRRRYQRTLEEQKMAVMGNTTARILHQVKNPVQSLLLQAELMQEFDRAGQEELRREAGEAIFSETLRLATMLSDLSAWVAGARRPLAPVPMPLHEVLAEMVRMEQPQAARRGVRLEMAAISEADVRVDPYYLRQAVENLLRNAQEAMADQDDARIRLELDRSDMHAVVRVRDNGPGIEPERLPHIFEPFVTTKGSGMGLGLPICKDIVEAHGGELRVESRPGEGTTFSILVPLATRPAAPADAHTGG